MGGFLSRLTNARRPGTYLIAVGFVAASCSSSSLPASSTTIRGRLPSDTTALATVVPNPPATRAAPNESVSGEDWQIGWIDMDERSVEVEWVQVEPDATYKLYRVLSIEVDPVTYDLDDADLVYTGKDLRFVDENVEADTFYTYIVVPSSDLNDRRWTDTLTTTDVTAPTPIVGLKAERADDGVRLIWQPSSDDVEFASYAVSIVEGDGSLTYIGGGADENTTIFIDSAWSGEPTTYAVQAVDFHDNRTELVEVSIG